MRRRRRWPLAIGHPPQGASRAPDEQSSRVDHHSPRLRPARRARGGDQHMVAPRGTRICPRPLPRRRLVTLDGYLGADYQALLTESVPEVAQHPPGQLGATRLSALRELIVLGQPALAAARGFAEVLALGQSLDPAVVRAASMRVQPTDALYV